MELKKSSPLTVRYGELSYVWGARSKQCLLAELNHVVSSVATMANSKGKEAPGKEATE